MLSEHLHDLISQKDDNSDAHSTQAAFDGEIGRLPIRLPHPGLNRDDIYTNVAPAAPTDLLTRRRAPRHAPWEVQSDVVRQLDQLNAPSVILSQVTNVFTSSETVDVLELLIQLSTTSRRGRLIEEPLLFQRLKGKLFENRISKILRVLSMSQRKLPPLLTYELDTSGISYVGFTQAFQAMIKEIKRQKRNIRQSLLGYLQELLLSSDRNALTHEHEDVAQPSKGSVNAPFT
jgi:hypothetical protein